MVFTVIHFAEKVTVNLMNIVNKTFTNTYIYEGYSYSIFLQNSYQNQFNNLYFCDDLVSLLEFLPKPAGHIFDLLLFPYFPLIPLELFHPFLLLLWSLYVTLLQQPVESLHHHQEWSIQPYTVKLLYLDLSGTKNDAIMLKESYSLYWLCMEYKWSLHHCFTIWDLHCHLWPL